MVREKEMVSKPDHYLETEHLQLLIDKSQDNLIWGLLGSLYGFKNGMVDDRTGEIFCPARDEELETFNSDGEIIPE